MMKCRYLKLSYSKDFLKDMLNQPLSSPMPTFTQYGPITNGGVRAHGDAAVRYRTILSVLPANKQ